MKKTYFKGLAVRLTLFSVLVGAVFIIHSCRKESKLGSLPLTDSVSKAKAWYESTYPITSGGIGSLSTLSVNTASGVFDYSQHIKPDWAHSATYHRLGKSVIEIPMDPSNNIQIALKNNNTGIFAYTKENTKTSFIILNDGKTNQAFVMTIMANASYIAGDPAKLAKNTYRHRDANFTGLVVYSTPKGQFVRAYAYNNGILLPPAGTSANAARLKIQGTSLCGVTQANSTQQKINSVKKVNDYWACEDWYQVIIAGGNITEQYLDTTCDYCSEGGSGTTGTTNPSPSPDDPGSSGTTTDPCSTPGTPTNPTDPGNGGGVPVNQNSVQHLTVNDVGDGGMGNPTANCTSSPAVENLNALIANDDYFLFDCDSLALLQINPYYSYGSMYQQVAQFTPSNNIQNRLTSLNTQGMISFSPFAIQNLSQAFGTVVNSDFFPIDISSLPPGMTMASITEYFRLNITSFTSGIATFSPYSDQYVNDTQLFNLPGSQSVGALVHINMANNGTVVESDYQSNSNGTSFKFSTMTSPLDNVHPVSGNREFGVYPDPNNPGHYTFYTMGVDRTSDWMFGFVNWIGNGAVFSGADALWTQMQTNMINYINSQGGHAGYYPSKRFLARPDYSTVQDYLNGIITFDQLKQKIGC
jgi:hypothetical protein